LDYLFGLHMMSVFALEFVKERITWKIRHRI
jgi:hypothetical protein